MNNEILDASPPTQFKSQQLHKLRQRGQLFSSASCLFLVPLQYILYAYNLTDFTNATGWDTSHARFFFISLLCIGGLSLLLGLLYFAGYNHNKAELSPAPLYADIIIYFFLALLIASTSYILHETVNAASIFGPIGLTRGNRTGEFGFILLCIALGIAAFFFIFALLLAIGYQVGKSNRNWKQPLTK